MFGVKLSENVCIIHPEWVSVLVDSVHPEMAIFRNICVGLRISILKIRNVFLWLKFSPALILRKLSHFWMDTDNAMPSNHSCVSKYVVRIPKVVKSASVMGAMRLFELPANRASARLLE